jgi:hypothetical protein
MTIQQCSRFGTAAELALSHLKSSGNFAIVVPAGSDAWRVLHSVNKASLKSEAQLMWLSLWERVSGCSSNLRAKLLRNELAQLSKQHHGLAKRALHELHDAELSEEFPAKYGDEIMTRYPRSPYVADHTGYGKGGENFEHDDTGSLMNYSGVHDDVYNSIADHEDWKEGYDY